MYPLPGHTDTLDTPKYPQTIPTGTTAGRSWPLSSTWRRSTATYYRAGSLPSWLGTADHDICSYRTISPAVDYGVCRSDGEREAGPDGTTAYAAPTEGLLQTLRERALTSSALRPDQQTLYLSSG